MLYQWLCLLLCSHAGSSPVTLVLTASLADNMGMPRLPMLWASLARFTNATAVHSLILVVPDADKGQFERLVGEQFVIHEPGRSSAGRVRQSTSSAGRVFTHKCVQCRRFLKV